MSQSATPATQNDILTCWEPSRRIGFAASPIDTATPQEKPEHRDETRGSIKTNISRETSSNFHTL